MIGASFDGFSHEPGAMLRAAREAKNIELAKMAADLRVDVTVLEAMEENRFDVFDAPVYAKGFLRKYAALVDLDVAQVIAAYDSRSGGPSEPTHIPVTPAAPRLRIRLPIRNRLPSLKTVGLVMVVVAALGAAYWYSGYRSEKSRVTTPPVAVEAKPDAAKPVTVTKDSVAEAKVAPSIPIQSEAADSPQASIPVHTSSMPEVVSDEITITGVKDAWVEVRGTDGSRLFYDHVRAGELRSVRAAGPWRIYLSDVDAVEVRLGAHIVDVPASRRTGAEARFGLKPNGAIL